MATEQRLMVAEPLTVATELHLMVAKSKPIATEPHLIVAEPNYICSSHCALISSYLLTFPCRHSRTISNRVI